MAPRNGGYFFIWRCTIINQLNRIDNENEEHFIWRLGQAKDNGLLNLDWNEIAGVINKEFRADESEYRTEAAYRKSYSQAKRFYLAGVFDQYKNDAYISELKQQQQEIRKEKQKLFDERTALNRQLREQARRESMYDIIKRTIDEYEPEKFEYSPAPITDSDNDVIIHLTDIHCGVDIHSIFNEYDSNILKQRLKIFLDEIYDIKQTYNPKDAYLLIGGDLIQGLIHTNSRIEAKENIVLQIMTVADLISNFIYELSKMFEYVEVHSTAGNHSRSTANKDEAVTGENFDLLIPYACKKDLKNQKNITFMDNLLGCDIATFVVRGHMIYGSHGDKDSPANVVYNMTKFARKAGLRLPDMCYLGHRHTNGLTTVDDVKVIETGCVDGMDNYSIDKRLVGSPEQTVTVVTEKRMIKALCDIQLN